MEKRTAALFCLMISFLAVLLGRLSIITTHAEYTEASKNNGEYRLTLARTRGKIYDRNGTALAGGATCCKALIVPSSYVSAELMKSLSRENYQSILDNLNGSHPFLAVVPDGGCECEGVTVYRVPQRYNDHSLAVHLVGWYDGNQGKSGIERAYDSWLSDAQGELSVTCRVSASGKSLAGSSRVITDTTGHSNQGVMLTIDANIQNIVEMSAAGHIERGAVVVVDAATGEILAMASFPGYNRNDIASYLNDERSPLINRAVAQYNAGSVFKPVVAAAALENGFDPEELYECTGKEEIGNITMGCIRHTAHGSETLRDAISKSCNTYFINMARKTGGSAIVEMAKSLGFSQATKLGDRYRSSGGHLPDEELLKNPAELANLSFGQGSLTVTPVQVAGMTAAIARGGNYIEPYVVLGLTDENKKIITQPYSPERHQAMSRETASVLGACMRVAVLEGTAKGGASDKVTSAAKTGTAETGIIRNGRNVNQAWYAGFFPYENPRYVCVVLCEDGSSGGASAGPVFREIAEKLIRIGNQK
jgi:Cell division protein FtsI/penicillin-binding protein 2